jgi:anti-sigma B factor antagonist
MSFISDKKENYTCISAQVDKLDSLVSPDLKAEIVYQNGNGERNLVIDLQQVKYIDSSGLSAILVAHRLCKNLKGTLIITGMNDNVKKLITISQLDSVLNIIQNPNEITDFILMDNLENDMSESD